MIRQLEDPIFVAQLLGHHIRRKNISKKQALKHIEKTLGGSFFGDLSDMVIDAADMLVPGVGRIANAARDAIDPYVNEEDKRHKSKTISYTTISSPYHGWNDWRLLDDIQKGFMTEKKAEQMFGPRP